MVPPNALSDGKKVTVYMGATTSGPFEFPEDCELRSAVVWLSISPSDAVFKRSVSVIVPHSAVFTSPEHHNHMKCVICEDYKSLVYKFSYPSNQFTVNEFTIDEYHGCIEVKNLVMVAIVAKFENLAEKYIPKLGYSKMPIAHCLAKIFWPRGELPRFFKVDIYYIYNLPTELYKVHLLSST